jgi:hypothetical protein
VGEAAGRPCRSGSECEDRPGGEKVVHVLADWAVDELGGVEGVAVGRGQGQPLQQAAVTAAYRLAAVAAVNRGDIARELGPVAVVGDA